ncbi:MAG TPA: hypothetical protein PLV22_01500 [Candidatus Cloacimonadota bacterium]|nr:hypothetical protein [Candidatus Cloacimonadota bacterium]
MRVYLTGDHKFPKRIGESIVAYYAHNNVVILRKTVKRALLPQNINIKNNQQYLCALWQGMDLHVKSLFADYVVGYKADSRQKRTQGISSFSMFIYFIYRLQRRFGILIKNMSIEYIMNILREYNSLRKLMKASLLYQLTSRLAKQNVRFIAVYKQIQDVLSNKNTKGEMENASPLKYDILINTVKVDKLE